MEKHSKKRRILPVAIALVAILAISGVAYAYWTSSGTGTGTATVGTSQALTVTQFGTVTGLVPDSVPHDVTVRVLNPATFSQSLSAVAISVNATTLPGGCLAAWFTVTDPTIAAPPVVLAAGASTDLVGQIQMDESGTNQDACQGATIDLDFAVS
jgi:hypothetical protein